MLQLATESRAQLGARPLPAAARSPQLPRDPEDGALAEPVELVVALLAREAVLDAPDDDGVAADLGPQLSDVGEAQQALGLPQVALEGEGQHEGVVAPRLALALENVVEELRGDAGGSGDLASIHAVGGKQAVEVVGELSVDRLALIEVLLGGPGLQQAGQQVLCQAFFRHVVRHGPPGHVPRCPLHYIVAG